MKKVIMEKWVRALRSGKYKQGRHNLKHSGRYCCLGVLCNISKMGKWSRDSYLYEKTELPIEVVNWAGLKSSYGLLGHISLMQLNDVEKLSFRKIANFIEKNWRRL